MLPQRGRCLPRKSSCATLGKRVKSMKTNDRAAKVDLSTLLALARVRDKATVNRARVLKNLSSSRAKSLAEAILDPGHKRVLSKDDKLYLKNVFQLAGVDK